MITSVQAINVTKVYDLGDGELVYALDRVSLEIDAGEMLAVGGGIGSGKSTLLHTLGCLQRPDSGRVNIEGLDVSQFDDVELARVRFHKVGIIYQSFNLLPNETVLANVEVALRHRAENRQDQERIAVEALEVVGLEKYLEMKPGQLNPSQRQCIAIARAIAHDPVVIIADEPVKVLDNKSRRDVMGLFQKLNEVGMTIVISTSDPTVPSYCRRLVRIEKGKIVDDKRVSKRVIPPPSSIPGSPPRRRASQEQTVCPGCNYGNPMEAETCQVCRFPLQVATEKERSNGGHSIQGDLLEELKGLPAFSELDSKRLGQIVTALEQVEFPKGSTIIKQGDMGEFYYIIRRGDIQAVLERKDGPGIFLGQLGPQEGFGEMALLMDEPRTASVLALTDLALWRLPKDAFRELLSNNISVALYFNRILTQRLAGIQKRIMP